MWHTEMTWNQFEFFNPEGAQYLVGKLSNVFQLLVNSGKANEIKSRGNFDNDEKVGLYFTLKYAFLNDVVTLYCS